ncbi:uncharacterized protein A4U43_C05F15040 [Asparagus officinalis]|uniref:Uncharacterized protein n=1 Tax=Asparagus officinalis TaxID=4686 RepID=A0A5P1ES03_ASPOF|nr:uncharacterized protein A4U43_C05F15040 [Asparagus officinalis]
MGFVYQKLPENHQRVARSGLRRKAWVAVRRVTVRVIRLYVGRRRWSSIRQAKKVTWAGLWVRMRKAMGLVSARERSGSYDSENYARNFDDGVWKEDEEFWRGGSFAYRFGHSGGELAKVKEGAATEATTPYEQFRLSWSTRSPQYEQKGMK